MFDFIKFGTNVQIALNSWRSRS